MKLFSAFILLAAVCSIQGLFPFVFIWPKLRRIIQFFTDTGKSVMVLEDEQQPDFTFISSTESFADLQVKPDYVKANTHFFIWTR